MGDTTDLASEIAVNCFKKEAVPLITLQTDQLFERALTDVPVEGLRMISRHEVAIAKEIDACITISGPANPTLLEKVPQEQFQAYREAGMKIVETQTQKKVRHANVHLGKVTRKRAECYNLEYSTW
ncbi:MAG: hypothetical protein ACFFBD_10855, partial [Candidatus Hodarchaeota archaeon]